MPSKKKLTSWHVPVIRNIHGRPRNEKFKTFIATLKNHVKRLEIKATEASEDYKTKLAKSFNDAMSQLLNKLRVHTEHPDKHHLDVTRKNAKYLLDLRKELIRLDILQDEPSKNLAQQLKEKIGVSFYRVSFSITKIQYDFDVGNLIREILQHAAYFFLDDPDNAFGQYLHHEYKDELANRFVAMMQHLSGIFRLSHSNNINYYVDQTRELLELRKKLIDTGILSEETGKDLADTLKIEIDPTILKARDVPVPISFNPLAHIVEIEKHVRRLKFADGEKGKLTRVTDEYKSKLTMQIKHDINNLLIKMQEYLENVEMELSNNVSLVATKIRNLYEHSSELFIEDEELASSVSSLQEKITLVEEAKIERSKMLRAVDIPEDIEIDAFIELVQKHIKRLQPDYEGDDKILGVTEGYKERLSEIFKFVEESLIDDLCDIKELDYPSVVPIVTSVVKLGKALIALGLLQETSVTDLQQSLKDAETVKYNRTNNTSHKTSGNILTLWRRVYNPPSDEKSRTRTRKIAFEEYNEEGSGLKSNTPRSSSKPK